MANQRPSKESGIIRKFDECIVNRAGKVRPAERPDENLREEVQQKRMKYFGDPGQLQQVPPRPQAQMIVTQQGQSAGGVVRTQQTFSPQVGRLPFNVRQDALVQQGPQPRMKQQMIQPGAIQQHPRIQQQQVGQQQSLMTQISQTHNNRRMENFMINQQEMISVSSGIIQSRQNPMMQTAMIRQQQPQVKASEPIPALQQWSQQQILKVSRKLKMNPHLMQISQIEAKSTRRELRKDTIIARCTWQTDLKTSKSKEYVFARVNLLDGFTSMDQIRLTAFDELSHKLLSEIKVGNVVCIINFQSQKVNRRHNALPHGCEISLDSSSRIFIITSECQIPREMIYSFTPLAAIGPMPPLCIDIKGVLVKVGNVYTKHSFWQQKYWTMRDFWLIDDSKYILKISLWEERARSFTWTIGEIHIIHCLKKTVSYGRQYVNIQMCSNHVTQPADDESKVLHNEYKSMPGSFTTVVLPSGSCVSRQHFDLAKSYLDDGGEDMTQVMACALASADLGIKVHPSSFGLYLTQFRSARVYAPHGDEKYELAREYQERGMSQKDACEAAAADLGYQVNQSDFSKYLNQNKLPSSTVYAPRGDEKYELARAYQESGMSQQDACEAAALQIGYPVDQGLYSRHLKKKKLTASLLPVNEKYILANRYCMEQHMSQKNAAAKASTELKLAVPIDKGAFSHWRKNNPELCQPKSSHSKQTMI